MVANKTDDDASLMTIEVPADAKTNTEFPISKMETENHVTYRVYGDCVEIETADGTQTEAVAEFGVVDINFTEDELAQFESEFRAFVTKALAGENNAEIRQTGKYTLEVTDSEGDTLTLRARTE